MMVSTTSLLAPFAATAQSAPVLPTGGRIAAGDAAIGPAVNGALTITQSSPTAIVNWSDFSIGTGGIVRFANGQGATLNRVDGTRVSRIDGSLQASGSVYLVNRNGVIVGRNGVVRVGGSFVASTLDISDADFQAGGDRTFSGASTAGVINLGRIGALGGDVALIATTVRNEGSLTAASGTAALAAGSTVLIRDAEVDGGRFVVLVGGRGTSVTTSGAITATVAELRAAGGSVYALAGNVSGVIAADQVTGDNGRVFLTAGSGGTVSIGNVRIASGTPSYGGTIAVSGDTIDIAGNAVIDVSATSIGGQVYVQAGQDLRFAGTVLARGGDQGGTVWTFGRSVDVAGATVDTRGAVVGSWTIEQPTLTIGSRLAGNVNRFLRTTNLTLAANPADFGEDAGTGDLTVAAPLVISGSNQLTLFAANTLRVNQNVTVAGSSLLNLYIYGTDEIGAPIVFAPNRSITFTGPAHGAQALFINDDQYTLIYSVADLQAMAADPAGHYAIARSFAAGGSPLSGPAVGAAGSDPFSGTFEGLNHSIDGLRIEAPGRDTVGLFGTVTGTIRDVALVGGSVVGGSNVGALAATLSDGSVLRASSSATVTARGSSVATGFGGLVGSGRFATIADSSATDTVYAPQATRVGGLVASGYGLSIVNSFATGAVTGGDETGGLVGTMSRSSIDNSYATGAVTGRSGVGGLVGTLSFGGVSNAYASGRVNGETQVGGLIGQSLSSAIYDVEARGTVNGTFGTGEDVGGLVGLSQDDDIARAVARNSVRGRTNVGGLIGHRRYFGTLTDGSASGPVSGTRNVGPLIGLDEPAP